MRVYIAASSRELDRAKSWMDAATAAGIEITLDWVEQIAQVGEVNPADLKTRKVSAEADVQGVISADVLWALLPIEASGRGCYFEQGLAYGKNIPIVLSRAAEDPNLLIPQSIFGSLCYEFRSDMDAFLFLCKLNAEYAEHKNYTSDRAKFIRGRADTAYSAVAASLYSSEPAKKDLPRAP